MSPDPIKEVEQVKVLDGETFKRMISFAVDWFAKSESDVNALNVFPVPDGDTGTNMLLTLRSSLEEAFTCIKPDISAIVKAMAHGALMGARGNSGVILSQIWRGMAGSVNGKEKLTGMDLAEAFQGAAQSAYEALENPVEGTMLTVVKDMAKSTVRYLNGGNENVPAVLRTAVEAAGKSVANTPNLLPVLKEAGVVDSGGEGLYILFEGTLMYLENRTAELVTGKSRIFQFAAEIREGPDFQELNEEVPYGYCTEFLLKGHNLCSETIRKALKKWGKSLIVTGDDSMVKIHIHSLDPSPVIHYVLSLGALSNVCIRNMDEQIDNMKKKPVGSKVSGQTVAVVAVATGEGIVDIFRKLGACAVVPGGQTMNPSTKQILQAVESIDSDNVIILPNDKNLVLVARQVIKLTDKTVNVVPAVTIPQGISALLAFDPRLDLQTNTDMMFKSKSVVRTIEVTRAIRSRKVNGFSILKDQAIGLLDGELLSAGDDIYTVILNILEQVDMASAETISIYYGAETTKEEADKIRDLMYKKNSRLNVDVLRGGQPLYNYIISIE